MPDTRHNFVCFRPDGQAARVFLTLHAPIVVTGGLRPNVFSAIVPWSELSKLDTSALVNLRGTIELWYSSDPLAVGTMPDVAMQGWYIVDVAPEVVGQQPGERFDAVQVYRVSFADHRHGFVEPRGGRLTHGELNPEPLPPGWTYGSYFSPGGPGKQNSDLIRECLTAMNIDGVAPGPGAIPATVDVLPGNAPMPPARSIRWLAAHAPTELAKLLEHVGHVYVPHHDGTGGIIRPGDGPTPRFPPSLVVSDVVVSSVDRRPRRVIVTSAPAAEVITFDGGAAAAPSWEFVAQDLSDGQWKRIADIEKLGEHALTHLRNGFPGPEFSDEEREHYQRQLYRAIRLDTDSFPPRQCAILRHVLDPAIGVVGEPSIRATVAQRVSGAWMNVSTVLPARTIVAKEGVIVFDHRLGKVTGTSVAELDQNFAPLAEPEIRPTFSVEAFADQRKRFAVFGFELVDGQLARMDATSAAAAMVGYRPDTAIYNCPELRVIRLHGDSDDRDNVEWASAAAQSYARHLIAAEGIVARRLMLKGFVNVELSEHVSEVAFSQSEACTWVTIDGWHVPTPWTGAVEAGGGGGGPSDLMEQSDRPTRQTTRTMTAAESRASAPEVALAGTLRQPPASALDLFPSPEHGFRPLLAQVVGPISGQLGRYHARSISGKLDHSATGNLVPANLGVTSPNTDLELWFTGDIGGTSPGGLKAGDIVHALTAGPRADGKLLAVACGPRMKQKSVVTAVGCAGGVLTVISETVWVFDQ